MELTQLKQFAKIAELGSISEAAEQLYISQPALSTMIKKLEAELGITLFERTRNKITLNQAGGLALRHAQGILAQEEKMKTELRGFSRREHIFKVGFCDPGPMWYAVPKFALMFPELELQPKLYQPAQNTAELLQSGQFDLLITAAMIEDNRLICQPFIADRLLLSIESNATLPSAETVSLKDIALSELALFYVDGAFWRQQTAYYQEIGKTTKITRFNDFFLFQQYLKDSHAATVSTDIVQHYRTDSGNRHFIPITDPEANIDYHFAYLPEQQARLQPLMQWLEFCRAEIKNG
ncbi:DNA-binding transcriptional LysR family regulator [Cricetibacter osteomyelitidis]|uniref:DNA-binding transcriptional LysR family regulator n=1 Tax=Cricetibacter osteomyelitidis TaxID=1521931 RepID=A0A4R2SZI0_9PAST|nr:LysR family transcriptional regulator [Cricetibacter osteomyelitidis]TCP95979.1 DNA-binding transcriptional LysR family regulator [Cricetibacter osteomyelitidis]